MIILPLELAFHGRSAQSSRFPGARRSHLGKKQNSQPKPSNPHGPFGFWTGISVRARVRPERVTKEIGCWKFPLESTSTSCSLLFFCFVDGCKSLHTFQDGMDFVCGCCYVFLVGSEPLRVDSIPTRLDGRLWDLSPRFFFAWRGGRLPEGKPSAP